MKNDVAIVSIGDELLNGFTVDTNSSWIARFVSDYNLLNVRHKITLRDDSESIKSSLDFLLSKKCSFIFITGGLGSTHDDITRNALNDYFKSELILDNKHILYLKDKYPSLSLEIIKNQSKILSLGKPIPNNRGTAIGMSIPFSGSHIFILPGVPLEMKNMINSYISPVYIEPYYDKKIRYITILTTGIYETKLHEILGDIINSHKEQFQVSFLPNYMGVKIRLTAIDGVTSLNNFRNQIVSKIDRFVFGFNDDTIEEKVANLLIKNNLTLAIAESCTGGYLSKRLTDVPGSSKFYIGSVIAYSNEIKKNILNVDDKILQEKGAVSKESATMLAENIRKKFKSDIGIATTGISGPDGGNQEKPVGLIYIAISTKGNEIVKKFNLIPDRVKHRKSAVQVALNMLRLLIKNKNK